MAAGELALCMAMAVDGCIMYDNAYVEALCMIMAGGGKHWDRNVSPPGRFRGLSFPCPPNHL